MLTPGTRRNIPQLDGIRGLAILMVLLHHCYHAGSLAVYRGQFAPLRILELGWAGVDLFFVLSGFLLGGILLDEKGTEGYFARFYLRRAGRILPLYLGWLVLCRSLYAAWDRASMLVPVAGLNIPLVYHLLFLQNFAIAANQRLGTISWSLAVEEQFYLIVPAAVALLEHRSMARLLIAYLIGAPLLRVVLLAILKPASSTLFYVLLPTHGDGMAAGLLMAIAIRSRDSVLFYQTYRRSIAIFAAGLAAVTLAAGMRMRFNFDPRSTYLYTPLALLCGWLVIEGVLTPGAAPGKVLRAAPLRFLGHISYCLYLVHFPALILSEYFQALPAPRTPAEFFWTKTMIAIPAMAASVLIAMTSMRWFEGPILRWTRAATSPPASNRGAEVPHTVPVVPNSSAIR